MTQACHACGKTLSSDETGLSRKLINRGTTVFFCWDCLAKKYAVSVEQLRELAQHFREAGCTLFP